MKIEIIKNIERERREREREREICYYEIIFFRPVYFIKLCFNMCSETYSIKISGFAQH